MLKRTLKMTKAHKKPKTQSKMNTKHESVHFISNNVFFWYILCSVAVWVSCISFFPLSFTAHLDQDSLEENILNFNGNFLIKLMIKKESNFNSKYEQML